MKTRAKIKLRTADGHKVTFFRALFGWFTWQKGHGGEQVTSEELPGFLVKRGAITSEEIPLMDEIIAAVEGLEG